MQDVTAGMTTAAADRGSTDDERSARIRGAAVRAGMAGNALVALGLACVLAALGGWSAPLFAMLWDIDSEPDGWSGAAFGVVGDWWPALLAATVLGLALVAVGVLWSISILRRAQSPRPTAVTFATLGIARGAELVLSVVALAPVAAGIGGFLVVVAAALDPLASPVPTLALVGVGTSWVVGISGLVVGLLVAPPVALGIGAAIGAWMGSARLATTASGTARGR